MNVILPTAQEMPWRKLLTHVFLSNLHFLRAVIKAMAVRCSPTPQNLSHCLLKGDGRWSKLAIYSVVLINTATGQQPTATARTCMQINMKGSSNSWATQQKTHRFSSTLCFWASPREWEEKPEGQGPTGGGVWVTPQGKPRLLWGPSCSQRRQRKHTWERSRLHWKNETSLYWSWQDEAKTDIRETNFNGLGLTGSWITTAG